MQELIEHLEKWMLDDKYVQDNPLSYELYMVQHANQMVQVKEHFIRLCKSMLQKEKEVIMDAHIEGQRVFDKFPHTQWTNDQAEQYYNENFNQIEMKLVSLQPFDDEYQVFDFNDQVLFKGTQKECVTFMSSSSDLRCVECGGNKDVKLSAMQNFMAFCENCRDIYNIK